MKHYDVIVVGAGHAGVEAALASVRRGAATALISFSRSDLGVMSCNPAIGGIGKGHLVREIDALDGMMARAADYAGIQYRLLNRSRGPAVRGPRVQADRLRYAEFVRGYIEQTRNLDLIEGEVVDLVQQGDMVGGVLLADGSAVTARSVVITTGTFLGGLIHIGAETYPAGRRGAVAADRLAQRLRELAFDVGRLKTGTPARLVSKTIDWDRVGRQKGDAEPMMMSFMTSEPKAPQIACGITHTNTETHDIIRENIGLSAMYSGRIDGIGPRYCPSVEDKVSRFADKPSHMVFLEPESLDGELVYPNGISTSLPREVQDQFIHTIEGLAAVEIRQYGYAIEYDYVDPRSVGSTLMTHAVKGLFLAGQINGTTGYEEAAAQGLLAGLNAANWAMDSEFTRFARTNSYLGVMIDDLVSKGVSEPYRMFTSRAEFRLFLRADNADERLTEFGVAAGVVGEERLRAYDTKARRLNACRDLLSGMVVDAEMAAKYGLAEPRSGKKRSVYELLGLMDQIPAALGDRIGEVAGIAADDLDRLHGEAAYAPYIERQRRDIERIERSLKVAIPDDLDLSAIAGLSSELRSKLAARRPESLEQARNLEGMTPAALVLLLAAISNYEKRRSAAVRHG